MFEEEKHLVEEKISAYCQQQQLPHLPLEWRSIPFSGEWGMAIPLFALAAKAQSFDTKLTIPQRAHTLAQDIAQALQGLKGFSRIEAVRGYVNLYFSTSEYAQRVVAEAIERADAFGSAPSSAQKTMVEYSQPNTHKSMHVGHLRNVILGGAVANILESAGDQVIRANYIGDIGLHVIKWLCNYELYHLGEQPGEDMLSLP